MWATASVLMKRKYFSKIVHRSKNMQCMSYSSPVAFQWSTTLTVLHFQEHNSFVHFSPFSLLWFRLVTLFCLAQNTSSASVLVLHLSDNCPQVRVSFQRRIPLWMVSCIGEKKLLNLKKNSDSKSGTEQWITKYVYATECKRILTFHVVVRSVAHVSVINVPEARWKVAVVIHICVYEVGYEMTQTDVLLFRHAPFVACRQ